MDDFRYEEGNKLAKFVVVFWLLVMAAAIYIVART